MTATLSPVSTFSLRAAEAVNEVAYWLPFRYMLSFPVELVTGGLDRPRALLQLGAQWAFVALLLGIAAGAWRLGTRRFAAHGG